MNNLTLTALNHTLSEKVFLAKNKGICLWKAYEFLHQQGKIMTQLIKQVRGKDNKVVPMHSMKACRGVEV
jgi:hypothetical protein